MDMSSVFDVPTVHCLPTGIPVAFPVLPTHVLFILLVFLDYYAHEGYSTHSVCQEFALFINFDFVRQNEPTCFIFARFSRFSACRIRYKPFDREISFFHAHSVVPYSSQHEEVKFLYTITSSEIDTSIRQNERHGSFTLVISSLQLFGRMN